MNKIILGLIIAVASSGSVFAGEFIENSVKPLKVADTFYLEEMIKKIVHTCIFWL